MNKLVTLFAAVLTLIACKDSSKSEPTPVSEELDRTVIIYMSGENNLDAQGFLTNDIKEIVIGSKDVPQNSKLVLFVDKQSTRNKPYIAAIKDGVCDTLQTFSDEFYASDPEQFATIIATIQEAYKAKEYGLVLWGHATGWLVSSDSIALPAASRHAPRRAYGVDTGSDAGTGNRSKWMNITQMRKVLEDLPRFRFILADCCCMMCVENAFELRHVTDYLIGSPAEIPGDGAPYHLLVKDLFLHTDSFYRNIIDDYYDYYAEEYRSSEYADDPAYQYLTGNSVPLSVVDTRYMDDLAAATAALIQAPEWFDRENVPYYFCYDLPSLFDMSCMMQKNYPADDYRSWKQTLDKAVPYRRFSGKWMTIYYQLRTDMKGDQFQFSEENYGGLGMHIPYSFYDALRSFEYNSGFPNFGWYYAAGWNRVLE